MPVFFLWIAALVRHWVMLIGGAGVSAGLLVYGQFAPDQQSKLPEMIWWTGIAIGFIGASYSTWFEEQERASVLATVRPEFSPAYAGLEQHVNTAGWT